MNMQRIEELVQEFAEQVAEACVNEDEFVPALTFAVAELKKEIKLLQVEVVNPPIVG